MAIELRRQHSNLVASSYKVSDTFAQFNHVWILEVRNIKLNGNPSRRTLADTCGQADGHTDGRINRHTDRQTDMTEEIGIFRHYAKAPDQVRCLVLMTFLFSFRISYIFYIYIYTHTHTDCMHMCSAYV